MDIERKQVPFVMEDKGLDMDRRTFKMYAAVYGNFDGQDVIEYGAGKKSLKESGHRVKVYWIHDFNEPIGKPIELREVPKSKLPHRLLQIAPDATGGLFVYGKISQTRRGDEALVLMHDEVFDEGSIGFKSIKEEYGEVDGKTARFIKEYQLLDVSPVPLAMNPAAIVTDVKNWDDLEPWDDEKPYPNEHACRLKDPDQYDTCRRGSRQSDGKKFYVIYCKKTGGKMEDQAYRYPKDTWSADEARAHCKEHDGSFEAAEKAQEPPQGALPADQIRSRERRLRLAKSYTEVWTNVEEETGAVP